MTGDQFEPLQDYCADLVSTAPGASFIAGVRSREPGEWIDVLELAAALRAPGFDLAAHGYEGRLMATWLYPPEKTGYEFMIVFCAPDEIWSTVTFHGGHLAPPGTCES